MQELTHPVQHNIPIVARPVTGFAGFYSMFSGHLIDAIFSFLWIPKLCQGQRFPRLCVYYQRSDLKTYGSIAE